MGTFATTSSLQTLMPGITFDSATTSLVSACITWAEGFIRNQLSRRYNLASSPFNTTSSIPTHITSLTEQMAMGYYFKNASRGAKESISRGEALLKAAQMEITEIANYQRDLVDNSFALVSSRADEVFASFSSYHTTFDEDDPLNWKPDTDKLDDIDSDRG
jgi:hypothetical protein